MLFRVDFVQTGVSELHAVAAMPASDVVALDPSTEYLGFRFTIDHAKATGVGACAGCATPALIYLRSIHVTQPAGVGDFTMTSHEAVHAYFVGWQCDAHMVFDHGDVFTWGFENCSVATRRTTWGQIHGLYR